MLIYPYVVQVFITQNGGDINTDDDGDSTDDTPNGTWAALLVWYSFYEIWYLTCECAWLIDEVIDDDDEPQDDVYESHSMSMGYDDSTDDKSDDKYDATEDSEAPEEMEKPENVAEIDEDEDKETKCEKKCDGDADCIAKKCEDKLDDDFSTFFERKGDNVITTDIQMNQV